MLKIKFKNTKLYHENKRICSVRFEVSKKKATPTDLQGHM